MRSRGRSVLEDSWPKSLVYPVIKTYLYSSKCAGDRRSGRKDRVSQSVKSQT